MKLNLEIILQNRKGGVEMRQYYGYENFKEDTNKLLEALRQHQFEAIVCIARGGYTLAHAVAEGLDIRDLQSLRTELYDDTQKRESLTLFGECEFLDKKKVLVLDDIADSGETLMFVMKYLQEKFPDIDFYSATLFYKKSSVYEPDFWVNEATNWIDFFWERDFLPN